MLKFEASVYVFPVEYWLKFLIYRLLFIFFVTGLFRKVILN